MGGKRNRPKIKEGSSPKEGLDEMEASNFSESLG